MAYLNVEQSPKSPSRNLLNQDGINRAFSAKQRQSNLIYESNGASIIMISGKNTNHLGVEQMPGSTLRGLQVTNLERTLIDIVVRPAYAGGISKVIAAYRTAKDRASVDQLLSILDKLNYVYPYHQAIGFLMEKVGFPKKNLERLQSLGLQHDFYLVHGMHQPKYSREWRLFFPADIRA